MLERLGDFKLLDLLGEGGMGAVYRAIQESLGREVAVKVLPDRLTRDPQFVQRFYREARSAAGLVHPSIIQIYSLGQDELAGLHYYAMEFVRGKDLSQILRGGARFSVEQALAIVAQVAEALCAAAEGGIIHRDIKPANIMLTARGQVKVMDFGLAKMVDEALDVTAAGTIVGTANYMSPEQAQGRQLDVRTDIYSLGAVFYELLAGQPPFKADDPSVVIYQHIYERPRRPSELNTRVPPAVDRLVLRMLAKKPEERVSSPQILLEELRKLRRALISGAEGHGRMAPMSRPAAAGPLTPLPGRGGTSTTRRQAPGTRSVPHRPAPGAETPPVAVRAAADRPGEARPSPPPPATPATPVPAAPQSPAAPARPAGRTMAERARAGTLVVCDGSEYARRIYRIGLQGDYAVAAAGTGRDGMRLLEAGRPDVLVLDLGVRDPGAFAVLDAARRSSPDTAVLAVTAEGRAEEVAKLSRYGLSAVLIKPVRMGELRARVAAALLREDGGAGRRARCGPVPQGFLDEVAAQEEPGAGLLDVTGLAARLSARRPVSEAAELTRRLGAGSRNQAAALVRECFGALGDEEAWKFVIYAFKEGDHRVRILAAELAASRFDPRRAAELLTRFAADGDHRVRAVALRALAAAGAPGAEEILARFLNDESWKVRRAAARALEGLAGGARVIPELVVHYALSGLAPPSYLQRLVRGPDPSAAVARLERAVALARVARVREFVAGLLGQAGSRAVVPALLRLVEDEHPAVRIAAARALASFPDERVRAALLRRLTDERLGVVKAVSDALGALGLPGAARGLIGLFTAAGQRVPEAAAAFIAGWGEDAGALERALCTIGEQPEKVRQVLAFAVRALCPSEADAAETVRRLRSRSPAEAAAAARGVVQRLSGLVAG